MSAIRWMAVLIWALAGSGCTVQHIQHDSAEVLEWLRLKNGARVQTTTRWQLPRDARIQVVEAGPAPDPSWLAAAQAGVDRAFPAGRPERPDFRLLVMWPPGEEPRARPVSFWEIVDMDQFLPDFQGAFDLQVALVDEADGSLVEAAALTVTPHWFASESSGPRLVRQAFERFATDFRGTY